MSKVLFTHSYFYRLDPKQWRFHQPYPPLGTIQAAAVIRNAGFDVSLFDNNLRSGPAELEERLRANPVDYLVIYDDGFNYLTKMCLTNMREAAFAMVKTGKRFGCRVIVCGSDAHDHYEKYLSKGADYVIRGEGEMTLLELINGLEKHHDVSNVVGLVHGKDGKVAVNAPRPVLRNLNELPMPAWDLVDVASYRRIWKRHHGYFSMNIATTRGCPFKCNWCAKPIYGNRYNSRSAGHVVQEIEWLQRNYGVEHFWMCDDIFGLKPGWVQEFAKQVNAKGLKFSYKIQSRVDLLLEDDTVEALAESGAETVWVGAESGSQKILDAMDKGTTVAQIEEATRLLRAHGIRVGYFLQFGYTGETREDIDATIEMVLRLLPDEIGISVSYPLPGTRFYENVKGQLKEKTNWTDSDDLAMMFESTYSKEYYRHLHRYVHSLYRKAKANAVLGKLVRRPHQLTFRDLRTGLAALYHVPNALAQRLKLKSLETVVS